MICGSAAAREGLRCKRSVYGRFFIALRHGRLPATGRSLFRPLREGQAL